MISVACGHRASHASRCAVMKLSTAHIWNAAENLRDVTPESWIEHAGEKICSADTSWTAYFLVFWLSVCQIEESPINFFCLNGKKSPLLALTQR